MLRLLAFVLSGAGMAAAAAAATLPPGATPCLSTSAPADYGTFQFLQTASYLQQGAAAPAEVTTPSPTAWIQLQAPAAYGISNALVRGPAGTFQASLTRLSASQSAWEQTYASDAAMQAVFQPGSWLTSFQLIFPAGESFVGFVPFTLADGTAPVPQVVNLAAAQAIPAGSPFTLSWIPWVGSSTNDRVALHIVDAGGTTVFSAATDCGGAASIAAGASSVTLPANRLQAGRTYTGYLTFGAALVSTNDSSSLIALRAEHTRTTRFALAATSGGGGGTPGDITSPSVVGTNLVFTLTGAPGTTYAIESTTTFTSWNREAEVTLPATGTLVVTIPILPTGGGIQFYRAVSLGGGGGGDVDPATLGLTSDGARSLRLSVAGTPGATYAIEQSQNFTNWTALTNVVIPAGATSITVTLTIPEGAPHAVLRAVGTGSPDPGPGTAPTVALVVTGSTTTLGVTGGGANQSYTVQQVTSTGVAGPAWDAWAASGKTLVTDGTGKGTVVLDPPSGATPPVAVFYRVVAP